MALGSEIKSSGITANTPKNVLLSAGTIHKNLKFENGAWNFEESLICATSGGSKLSITPTLYDIPVDGAFVKVKGLTEKVGETAKMEINPVEITPELLKNAVFADAVASEEVTGYTELKSKARIEDGDYLENMGFIGRKVDGTPIVIIFDFALCTSGLELETKDKEAAVPKFVYECYAPLTSDAETLPYHIYYPSVEAE